MFRQCLASIVNSRKGHIELALLGTILAAPEFRLEMTKVLVIQIAICPTYLHVSPDLGNAAVEIISPRLSHALEFHTPSLCGLEVRGLLHDEFGIEKVTAFQACPESIFQSSGESRPLRNGRHHLRKLRPEFPSFVQVQARNEQYRTCERFGRSGLCGEQL